jgi:hypothetical protein
MLKCAADGNRTLQVCRLYLRHFFSHLFVCSSFLTLLQKAAHFPHCPCTVQLITKERSHTLTATKGSLCLFGSTEFVNQFQAQWQRDGYCDYTQPPQAATLSGTHVSATVTCPRDGLFEVLAPSFIDVSPPTSLRIPFSWCPACVASGFAC